MREIVRLTAQKDPLEMGVPLYPFSRESLWADKNQTMDGAEKDSAGGMPLPSSPPIDGVQLSPGAVSVGLSPVLSSHRSVTSGWPTTPPSLEEEVLMTSGRGPYI